MMLKLESEFETRTKSSEETLQQSPSLKGQLELFTVAFLLTDFSRLGHD